jgi:hypothetical protein
LEYIFKSIRLARGGNAIYYIEGREKNVRIDEDEAREYLRRTGVVGAKYGQTYRQVHFWLPRGREQVYNERDIRTIAGEVAFSEEDYLDWARSLPPEVFEEDVKGLSWDEFLEAVS